MNPFMFDGGGGGGSGKAGSWTFEDRLAHHQALQNMHSNPMMHLGGGTGGMFQNSAGGGRAAGGQSTLLPVQGSSSSLGFPSMPHDGGGMMGMNPDQEGLEADMGWAFEQMQYGCRGTGAGGGAFGPPCPVQGLQQQQHQHQHAAAHQLPAPLHMQESFHHLVTQILPPHSHMMGSDACYIVAQRLMGMYDAKDHKIEKLKKRVQSLESSKQQEQQQQKVTEKMNQEVEQLKGKVGELSEKNKTLREEMAHVRDVLVSSAAETIQDVIPIRLAGIVSTADVQNTLGGYTSRKMLEETTKAVNEAIQDPAIDPFQWEDGIIVGEDMTHASITAFAQRYGNKMARLVVDRKRDVAQYCPQSSAYPSAILWDENRELHVNEVILRLVNALQEERERAAAGGRVLPPQATTVTTSGRRVTLNPRLYDGADGDSKFLLPENPLTTSALLSLSSAGGGGSRGASPAVSSSSCGAVASSSSPSNTYKYRKGGGSGGIGFSSKKRRPRAPMILTPAVRHSFARFMMRNSSMSEGSAQMFCGAANALIHRVLSENEGEVTANTKMLNVDELTEIVQRHADSFERHTKNAYANLPRIWKLLQGFTGFEYLPGGGEGNNIGGIDGGGEFDQLTMDDAEDFGEDYEGEMEAHEEGVRSRRGSEGGGLGGGQGEGSVLSTSGANALAGRGEDHKPASGGATVTGLGGRGGGSSSGNGRNVGNHENVAPAPPPPERDIRHEEDDDEDFDLRGIIFGLPSKPKPRVFYGVSGVSSGGGTRKRPLTAGRNDDPRRWGMTPGQGKRPATPIVLSEEVREGFIGWMAINTANRGSSLTTILRSVNNFMARMLPRFRGENAYVSNLSIEELRALVDKNEIELTLEVARGTNQSLRTFWRHLVNFLREANTEGMESFTHFAQGLDIATLGQQGAGSGGGGAAASASSSFSADGPRSFAFGGGAGAMNHHPPIRKFKFHHKKGRAGGGSKVKKEEMGGVKRPLASLAPAASSSSSSAASSHADPFAALPDDKIGKKPRRTSPSTMNAEARQGFMTWMGQNTKMQSTSMTTALRTSNRVLATMLTMHCGADGVELSIEEIHEFVKKHNEAFQQEVNRTSNVSVKTFWRHFLKFLGHKGLHEVGSHFAVGGAAGGASQALVEGGGTGDGQKVVQQSSPPPQEGENGRNVHSVGTREGEGKGALPLSMMPLAKPSEVQEEEEEDMRDGGEEGVIEQYEEEREEEEEGGEDVGEEGWEMEGHLELDGGEG